VITVTILLGASVMLNVIMGYREAKRAMWRKKKRGGKRRQFGGRQSSYRQGGGYRRR